MQGFLLFRQGKALGAKTSWVFLHLVGYGVDHNVPGVGRPVKEVGRLLLLL